MVKMVKDGENGENGENGDGGGSKWVNSSSSSIFSRCNNCEFT